MTELIHDADTDMAAIVARIEHRKATAPNVSVEMEDGIAKLTIGHPGLVPLSFWSLNSFKLPFVRTPRGFCRLATRGVPCRVGSCTARSR
ncbi:MAG: hypothetical protein AB8B51_20135, partial [Sedimentitalea sp.]